MVEKEFLVIAYRIQVAVFGLALLGPSGVALAADGDAICFPRFEDAGAVPQTLLCKLNCSEASVGMGTMFCTASGGGYIERYCSDRCYLQVVRLHKLPRPDGSPVNGFTTMQTCIAEKACLAKDSLHNSAWLDSVVGAFVAPYLQRSGRWPEVVKKCEASSKFMPFRDRWCERGMATYHIETDLQSALNANGCGQRDDWNAIGGSIVACAKSHLPPIFDRVAACMVRSARDAVRMQCVAYREAHHLPIDG